MLLQSCRSYSRGPIEHRDLTLHVKGSACKFTRKLAQIHGISENFQGNHKGNTSHSWQLPSHWPKSKDSPLRRELYLHWSLFMQTGHKLVQHAQLFKLAIWLRTMDCCSLQPLPLYAAISHQFYIRSCNEYIFSLSWHPFLFSPSLHPSFSLWSCNE